MSNDYDSEKNINNLNGVVFNPANNEVNILHFNSSTTNENDTFFLYFSVLTASIPMFVNGASLVWMSPVIPQLQSNNTDVNPLADKITTGQISLLSGLPSLFMVFGPLLLGKLADVLGRKIALLCISSVNLMSNVALAFGDHIIVFYVGKSLMSLCQGSLFVVIPIYLTEICEDHNRAKHGCLMMFFIPLGSLYGYLLGPVTSVKLFTLLCAAPLIPQLICSCLFLPETPFYTASKGDKRKTIEILRKLRYNKTSEGIENDYMQIETTLRSHPKGDVGGLRRLFRTRALRTGFIVGFGSCMATQMTGAAVIMSFLGPIFNGAGTSMSGNTVAIMVGTVKSLFFFVTVTIVGRYGRRPLLLVSSVGTGISLAILAVYFYLLGINAVIIESIRWLPIMCILVYISFFALGLGTIPYSILGELFPNDVRSTATSFIMATAGIVGFIIATAFPVLSESLGVHFCIGIFSAGCFLGFVFMYYLLPETKGKSFLEIQEILDR